MRREGDLGVDAGQAKVAPLRARRGPEGVHRVAGEIGFERLLEGGDRRGAGERHSIVRLHEEAAPAEVGRAADRLVHRPADHDELVVLQRAHVLALDVVLAGGGD